MADGVVVESAAETRCHAHGRVRAGMLLVEEGGASHLVCFGLCSPDGR